jgi:feruloyl esterase
VLAQRYPWHFDGILAGAPAYLTPDPINLFWRTATNLDDAGCVILGKDQLPLLHQAAIGQCDGLDGLEDGVIDDPWKCRVDLEALRCGEDSAAGDCLTPEQTTVAERIYRGALDAQGESLSPGAQPGSELSWAMYIREPHGQPGSFEPLSVAALRYIFFDFDPGPSYDPREFDYARDIERMFTRGFLYVPNNPDLTAFRKRGGKLLIYQGLNDLLDTDPLIDYYEKATRVAGGEAQVKSFFRLFLVPGMNHCRGGSGVDNVDWMSAMEAWVEAGTAPDVLIGAKLEAATPASASGKPGQDERRVVKTRPLYPYPHIARYKGDGDPDAAASFEPVPVSR